MLTSFEFCGILKKERSCQKKGLLRIFFFLPQKCFFALKGKKMFLREATNETQRTGESASGAAKRERRQGSAHHRTKTTALCGKQAIIQNALFCLLGGKRNKGF